MEHGYGESIKEMVGAVVGGSYCCGFGVQVFFSLALSPMPEILSVFSYQGTPCW